MQELIIHRNQEQAPPAYRLPGAGNLQLAVNNVKVRNDSVENLKQVLRLVMIKIGLRAQNWPTEEEKLVLIEHITTNYGGQTCEEIKLAFDMAISGKIDVKVNSFENFSCLYFSTVVNAYKEWARQNFKEPKYIEPTRLPPPKEDPMSDDEFIEMAYGTWKVRPYLGASPLAYEALKRTGKIKLSQEEKDEMYRQVETSLINKMKSDRNWHEELNPIYQSPNKDHWKARVFNECKRKAVENYFTTL